MLLLGAAFFHTPKRAECIRRDVAALMIDAQDVQRVAFDHVKDAERETVERPSAQIDAGEEVGETPGADIGALTQ